MKPYKAILLFIIAVFVTSARCKKDDPSPEQSLDKNVPATQTGRNTFGCLVNGQVFTASDQIFKPVNVFTGHSFTNGDYLLFSVGGSRNTAANVYASVSIGIDSLAVTAGQTIVLGKDTTGSAWGKYEVDNYGAGTKAIYTTTATSIGRLTFTRIDLTNNIWSGTFSFGAVDSSGHTISIAEGRFDVTTTPSSML